jgi:hypothetical protein
MPAEGFRGFAPPVLYSELHFSQFVKYAECYICPDVCRTLERGLPLTLEPCRPGFRLPSPPTVNQ